MKLCTILEVVALDGSKVTAAEVIESSLVPDDHQPPALGRPVQVGDRLHLLSELTVSWSAASEPGPLSAGRNDLTDEPCPSCGSDPEDPTLHREGCPRIDTCGQWGPPWLDPPWHPDDTWPPQGTPTDDPRWAQGHQARRRHRLEVHGVRQMPL